MKKDMRREFRRSLSRFLSITLIVCLGVGFFTGMKATAPSMVATVHDYYVKSNVMDYKLLSTAGFSDEDAEAVRKINGIGGVMPTYSVDVLAKVEDEDELSVYKIMALPEGKTEADKINQPRLLSGRMPETSGECVICKTNFDYDTYKIGDKVSINPKAGSTEVEEVLKKLEYEVVGIIDSPLYFSYDKGSSSIGNGKVNAYAMIPASEFLYARYTEMYVVLDFDHTEAGIYTEEYDAKVKDIYDEIDALGVERQKIFIKETESEISDAQDELDKKSKEAYEQLNNAKKQLDDAKKTLADALKKITDGWNQYNLEQNNYIQQITTAEREIADAKTQIINFKKQIADSEVQMKDARKKLDDGWVAYEAGVKECEDGRAQLTEAKAQLDEAQAQISAGQSEWLTGETTYLAGVAAYELAQVAHATKVSLHETKVNTAASTPELLKALLGLTDAQLAQEAAEIEQEAAELEAQAAELAAGKAELDAGQAELTAAQNEYTAGYRKYTTALSELNTAENLLKTSLNELESGETEYENGLVEIADGKQQIADGEKDIADAEKQLKEMKAEATKKFADAEKQLNQSQQEYNKGQAEYQEGLEQYETSYADTERQLSDGASQIAAAMSMIADISDDRWYIFSRDDAVANYTNFGQDTGRIDAIAAIFPVFFLIVAALVCLTTMSRMVEEQRTQMGTYKALGYSKRQIFKKYLTYALVASVVGGVIGQVICVAVFPRVITAAYEALYQLPPLIIEIPWDMVIISLAVGIACTVLVAFICCHKEIKSTTATLMRPKAPKAGRKTFLEKVPFIWNRFNFSYKITIRNLFRYKLRAFMTVIGITGCMALIVAGFGLNDAIAPIVDLQFGKNGIDNYDFTASMYEQYDAEEANKCQQELLQDPTIDSVMFARQIEIDVRSDKVNANLGNTYMMIPQNIDMLGDYITLKDSKSGAPVANVEGAVVITGKLAETCKVGVGDEIIINYDDKDYRISVAGIIKNYVYHYVYMSPATYKALFDKDATFNCFLCKTVDGTVDAEAILAKNTNFLTVIELNDMSKAMEDSLKGMYFVVAVLTVSAACLAVVVLYNLTNINISERIREIATTKVLGFTAKEANMYVFRENIIMTVVGLILGNLFGYVLAQVMINMVEVDMVVFSRTVKPMSYVYSTLITIAITFVVLLFMSKKIKKINMVEALKSIE